MRRRTALSAAATVGIVAAALTIPGSAAAVPQARITVSAHPTGEAIPPELIGANHRWPNGGLGMWDAEADAPDPTMVELSKQIGLGMVRYPGGTVANLFHWKKAIGPQSERGCQVGGGFVGGREPKDSIYGPDEHQRFVEQIGASTHIMPNASTSTTEEIADFVEYMNSPVGTNPNGGTAWAEVRAQNGHPEPYGIHWWELGNELYLGNQLYWRSSDPEVALRQHAFGGTQRQVNQALGTECDYRTSAGVSDGTANQQFRVNFPPVVPDSQTIYVNGQAWQEVADLASAGPDDTVYTIDDTTGEVHFGDGVHGAIPPDGAALTADYDSGPHPGFVDYYAAMKAVDPTIQICTTWGRAEWVELMGDEHPYDCLGPHLYGHPAINVPYEQIYDQMMNAGHDVLGEIRELKKAIARHRPNNPPAIEIGEYGAISQKETRPGPKGWNGSLMHTLYLADLMAGFVDFGVEIADVSNLNEDNPTAGELFGGNPPGFHHTARSHLLELYHHLVGSRPVDTDVRNNPPATGDGGYQALRVVAARSADGTTRIVVLNRDREQAITTQLKVDGVKATTVRVFTLNAPEYSSYNTYADPNVVHIENSQYDVPGSTFSYQFPAHSVTLLEIPAGT